MNEHEVRAHRSAEELPKEQQLAWKLAEMALDPVPVAPEVARMIANRLIDDAGVAAAALGRHSAATARAQALLHPPASHAPSHKRGAPVWGCPLDRLVAPEWAAWANGVAVRELDFHDTFLAAEYSHPGDTIPPLLAVAQHMGCDGEALTRGIAAAYEVQVDLSRAICLHAHKIDHVAHLGPAVAAGIGALLRLPTEVVYHAIGQALHTTTATRQSRKGQISSWKAYAPAWASKAAIEAVDRAMRGEGSPAPIYEGEDGVIAWLLDGPEVTYRVPLPSPGEPKEAILRTYTKQYSAEYQAQAFIDLARRLRPRLGDLGQVHAVHVRTSHHTHYVIGTGSGDPQKFDPDASRETLDHSLPYILAVALEDGDWRHERSFSTERSHRESTITLWRKISTQEASEWTARYQAGVAFGGEVVVEMQDGTTVAASLDVADAHPGGSSPWGAEDYIAKFRRLAQVVVPAQEQDRFLDLANRLGELRDGPCLTPTEVRELGFEVPGLCTDMHLGGHDDTREGLF